jgi:hypothetical protein
MSKETISDKVKNTILAWTIYGAAVCYGCSTPRADSTAKPDELFKLDSTVIYSGNVRENFGFLYKHVTKKEPAAEFASCLEGLVAKDGTVVVMRSELPSFAYTERDSVGWTCPKRTGAYIGYAHSHPPGSLCALSRVDSNTFAKDTLAKVSTVICDNNTMTSYTKRSRR